MYDRELVKLTRDCEAVRVPEGTPITIAAGTEVVITQSLGGNYTVLDGGCLARIDGRNADALGREPTRPPTLPEEATDDDVEKAVWDQMRTCYDPEIPIDIVELGLVYECRVDRLDDGGRHVHVRMTLTAPGCGMGDVLARDVKQKIEDVPGVREAEIELVFDPPWDKDRMSEAAKLQTGIW
jgi:probable FeS assembly SUF system protein SufT